LEYINKDDVNIFEIIKPKKSDREHLNLLPRPSERPSESPSESPTQGENNKDGVCETIILQESDFANDDD